MTLSSAAVSRQKVRARVSKLFYRINLNGMLSIQANDNASIIMRTKERDFAIAKCLSKRSKWPNKNAVCFRNSSKM